jgi:hypothetical protein
MAATLPPIETLPSASTSERARVLDLLFEPCDALHTLSLETLSHARYPSYNQLISAIGEQLFALGTSTLHSDISWLDKVLGAHPRLGAKKVDSAQSAEEQKQLQAGAEEEKRKLEELNEEYERIFPGLRYVVFVNGRSREAVMENMRERIERGDIVAERREAMQVS